MTDDLSFKAGLERAMETINEITSENFALKEEVARLKGIVDEQKLRIEKQKHEILKLKNEILEAGL